MEFGLCWLAGAVKYELDEQTGKHTLALPSGATSGVVRLLATGDTLIVGTVDG